MGGETVLINNIYTFSSTNKINKFKDTKEKVTEKVATGRRINRAADDASGLTISESFKAQVRGLSQAERNIQDGMSLLQVVDGALGDITDNLHRIRELSVHSSNGTLVDEDREALNEELKQIKEAIQTTVENTEFNKIKVLKHDRSLTIQTKDNPYTSMEIKLYDLKLENLELKDADASTQENSQNTILKSQNAVDKINKIRAENGAYYNNLKHTLMNTSNSNLNINSSLSVITDVNTAISLMDIVKTDVLINYSQFMYSNVKGNLEAIKNLIG
ncbi:flagellin [Clostridium tetani]|nr:flagellin [Clostridium tetani]RXI45913.1 flagellin [Clostridium tetani]RXI76250.1 flagellin [Clostridium tetani]RXM61305.1 flagellin [Clostridium tetani]RXM70130.1 flagellin [Clostridium tetani]